MPDMTTDGDRVRARRERLGIDKKILAKAAGVSRDTLATIEAGAAFRRSSLTKIERALAAAEEASGLGAPPAPADDADLIEFRVDRDGRFVARGPIASTDELTRAVATWILQVREEHRGHG